MTTGEQTLLTGARARWSLDLRAERVAVRVASLIVLSGVLAYVIATNTAALFRSWFLGADEWVYVFEVIRFSTGDFRQQFYDNPGTPLMLVTTVVLWLMYVPSCLSNEAARQCMNFGAFAYGNIPTIIMIMRLITFGCFIASIVLLYLCVRRMFNEASALVASLFLAFSWMYVGMSDSVRTESMANVLVLLGLLTFLYVKSLPVDLVQSMLPIGILLGVAAAARYTSLAVSAPLFLILIATSRDSSVRLTYSRFESRVGKGLVLVVLGLCLLTTLLLTLGSDLQPVSDFRRIWPFTAGFFLKTSIGVLVVGAGLLLLAASARTRSIARHIGQPRVLYLWIGIVAGFLIGTPTILWQYERFFTSINFYLGSYLDVRRIETPFLEKALSYVSGYVKIIAPDNYLFINYQLVLLIAGFVLAALLRNRFAITAAIVSALFFVSKPVDLIAAPHHVIPWLPVYAMVMAFPVYAACQLVGRLSRIVRLDGPLPGALASSAASVALVGYLATTINNGPATEQAFTGLEQQRLNSIQEFSDWIRSSTPEGTETYAASECFNDGVFYEWMKTTGLIVPDYIEGTHKFTMWWGQRSLLQGKAGYACATQYDVVNIYDVMTKQFNDGTNPYTDPAFHLERSFGTGHAKVDVFTFDLR